MHAIQGILDHMRGLLGLGRRVLRFEVSEEEILADLDYGRDGSSDDSGVTGQEVDGADRVLVN